MAKSHCDHRVVERNSDGTIIKDLPFDSFARAQPVYNELIRELVRGHEITLQHGARVIFKSCETAKKNNELNHTAKM